MIEETLSFDDVLILPQYSEAESRKNLLTNSNLDNRLTFELPIISSPMDTITEVEMAIAMSHAGGLGIVHRYNTIEEQASMCSNIISSWKTRDFPAPSAAAIGVSGDYLERAQTIVETGINIICIDIAHGHHALMKRALKTLRNIFGDEIHIMAGNVATLEGYNALADWGANSIRVGIGGGSICSTRLVSGHGVPTLHSIFECAKSDRDVKLIADGGIRTSGDIVKALAAGADFVILGSMLAGTDETPGEIFDSGKKKYKVYRGMASLEAQINWRGKSSTPEGISTTIPYKGSVINILQDLKGGIQSGLSYSGANTIHELCMCAKFIRQTTVGQKESSTHILRQ